MVILETERLRLRNWCKDDRDLFREINRDPKVMEFYPMRRSHEEADALMDLVSDMIASTGLGFYALADRETDEALGFCGLAKVELPGILPPDAVEIGWRLATRFWGQGYVTEAARALLSFGFQERQIPQIFSFAVETNHRSIAVMKRIGMCEVEAGAFNHPRVPETHPHLMRHVLYRADFPSRTKNRERQTRINR